MRKYVIVLAVALAVGSLGLAGCHKNNSQNSGNQIKQGANQMGQGVKNAGTEAGAYMSDAAITSKVKARLAGKQGLSSFDIHVKTDSGVVTLTGTVDSQAQRKRAGEVASDTGGVKGVNNNIEVKAKQ
jgi:hyperosmotically inducible protein